MYNCIAFDIQFSLYDTTKLTQSLILSRVYNWMFFNLHLPKLIFHFLLFGFLFLFSQVLVVSQSFLINNKLCLCLNNDLNYVCFHFKYTTINPQDTTKFLRSYCDWWKGHSKSVTFFSKFIYILAYVYIMIVQIF